MNQAFEGHIFKRFDQELGHIHLLILEIGSLAAYQLRRVAQALKEADLELAQQVIAKDDMVDALELKIDHAITNLVAQRNPMARDLRIIMTLHKLLTDLERVGDAAVTIAEILIQLHAEEEPESESDSALSEESINDLCQICHQATLVFEHAMLVLDNINVEEAKRIASKKHPKAEKFSQQQQALMAQILAEHYPIQHSIQIALLLRTLERIRDHALNIAEFTIYIAQGEDIRHPNALAILSEQSPKAPESN